MTLPATVRKHLFIDDHLIDEKRNVVRVVNRPRVEAPMRFDGERLSLRGKASGGGGRREIRDVNGAPFDGFTFDDCEEISIDAVDYEIRWKNRPTLTSLSAKTIRLAIRMHAAKLYAFLFV